MSGTRAFVACPRRDLVADAFDVFAGLRVDLDDVAFFDESGDEEFGSGFHLGGFRHVGCGVALGSRSGFDNFELHVLWGFDDDRVPVVQRHAAFHAVFDVFPDVAGDVRGDFVLFERGTVHEHVIFALAVQELDVGRFDVGRFEGIATFVSPVEGGAADQVFHFALVKCIAFAGFDEHHFGHQIRLAVDLDFEAFAKIASVVRCHGGRHSQTEKKICESGPSPSLQRLSVHGESEGRKFNDRRHNCPAPFRQRFFDPGIKSRDAKDAPRRVTDQIG